MNIEEISARLAIKDLASRYSLATDRRNNTDMAKLFAPEAVFKAAGMEPIKGRQAIFDFFDNLPPEMPEFWHHITVHTIDYLGNGQAKGTVYMCVLSKTGVDHWGLYEDSYCEIDGEWYFQQREATTTGYTASSFLAAAFESADS